MITSTRGAWITTHQTGNGIGAIRTGLGYASARGEVPVERVLAVFDELFPDRDALARGYNAHALEHLSALWKALRAAGLDPERARFAVTDTIEKLGGARPKTFEAFLREG